MTDKPEQKLKPCPFCGGLVHIHTGYQGMSFITCGQRDDGSDGCGAVISFRPDVRGEGLKKLFNARVIYENRH